VNTQWIIFASILIANAAAALVIAIVLARRPLAQGKRALILMLLGLAVWTFCYAMITLSASLDVKHVWLKLENIGIVSVPVLWFFFTAQYTRLDRWLTRPVMVSFWIIPIVTLLLLFSGRWFHLYYSFTAPVSDAGGPLTVGRGPWYMVQLVQSYLLYLAGTGILTWRFIQYRNIYRQQLFTLLGAILVPMSVNVAYQVLPKNFLFPSMHIDLTPLTFTVTAILIGRGIFGLQLFNLAPIARHIVMEHIPEMVFVVDSSDRVLDANSVAQRWLGKDLEEIIGQDPLDVFREWPQLLNRFLSENETREEIQIPGNPPRTLELVITPLYNKHNVLEGRVIVAHDITQRKLMEEDLQRANDSLKTQLDENEILRAKLQEQAIRDPLTGVYNRRFLAESIEAEIARAARENVPVSVVILDIDHFKQFNDVYGHKCGDVVLQTIANFLNDNTRRGDILCRYGGEEFVVLMPNAAVESAYERAEKWRRALEEMVIEYEGMKLQSTFSAGVAGFPLSGLDGDSILKSADKALYKSKADGRNRVTIHSMEVQ